MTDSYLLGIDIGTSACKVTLFSVDGEIVAREAGDFRIYRPAPGWAEQDPNEWWDVSSAAVKRLLSSSGVDAARIAGVGVDGQSWSAIPIDRDGTVLRNTPIWMDTRAAGICRSVVERFPEEEIFHICGNPFKPCYTTPKILWYEKEEPRLFEKTYKILQSNAFIVFRLTGELSHDLSQGYGLHFFDMRKRGLDGAAASRLGVDASLIPPLCESHGVVGAVTRKAAACTGLAEGTPVVAGGLDAACGTLGAGVVTGKQTQEQGGQAGGMSICTESYRADPRLILSPHVVPGIWLLQGGTVGGGGALKWAEAELGAAERAEAGARGVSAFRVLDEEAERIAPGSDGVVFLPYLSGERSPLWDERAKGVWYGLDYRKTRAHLFRAVLEGVAFSLRHNIETAREAGAEAGTLHTTGGGAASGLWNRIKADVTGHEIVVTGAESATGAGAVMLAGVGTGIYSGFKEAVSVFTKENARYGPDAKNKAVYDRGYEIYRELYERLRPVMHRKEAL
ncbi:MAG: FGGY-family carbohydrate kinase [Clostridiales Family XIII bacterium]|jgi:xylulokinase|nr:FGGY-family carbohydrate kinase [Clostridiales Family XIII bacterium]